MAVSAILHANEAKGSMKQFQCIKIQSKTIDLSTRLGGITTEFVGFCSPEVNRGKRIRSEVEMRRLVKSVRQRSL